MNDPPLDLTSPGVTARLLLDLRAWRVRAVERLDLESAAFCRRRRSLQRAPLRPLLDDLLPSAAPAGAVASIIVPVALLPKGPLVDLDITGPHGTGQLVVRQEIAERQVAAIDVAAHDAGLVIPPSLSSTLALLLGFSDGPWRATRKWGQAASYRQRDYLRDEVLPGELDSLANSLADYALVCRAVLAGRGSGGAPPELDSPMEEPLLAFPLLRRAGHDTRSALSELGRYADFLTDAEASSGAGSEAADFVLNSLAEYGRYWHLMALLPVPIDSPFVLTYEERDALTVRWPFNRIALDVVTADAGSNHVTLRVPDASARLLAPRLVSTATGRSAELITTSTETRELLSFYTWDRERTERVSFRVLLAPTLGVSVLSAAVFALQIGLSALLYTKGAASLSELALVAGPVGFAASLLLLREPSTLAVRLRRTSTWAILGALVVLLVITTWQAYQLLDTPAHPVRSNVSIEE